MPELPEVETMVRGVKDAMCGNRLTRLRRCPCRCKPLAMRPTWSTLSKRVRGQVIIDVRRLAKRVLIELEDHSALVIEPRMTGLMLVSDPPDRGHLRLKWELESTTGERLPSVWFWDRRGLGTATWLPQTALQAELGPTRLGPDALTMTGAGFQTQLSRTRRAIKVALLDQKLVAGIGNLYASEILHLARISPLAPASNLNAAQCERLADSTRKILQTAIRYEGSTLSDGTYRNALNDTGRYQNEHRVYAKHDEVCRSCDRAKIERIVQAQRSTFFCPVCQRAD